MGKAVAGTVFAVVFPQQGLLFSGISRDLRHAPPGRCIWRTCPRWLTSCYSPVSFNVAHSHSSRFREPVWAQLWHQCCANLLHPPLSFCGCTISAMLRSTLACILLYVTRIIALFTFIQASVATPTFVQFGVLRRSQLEDVPEEKFLGTTCSVTQGTITTLKPVDTTVLRTLRSVGNREQVLSGFSARTRTIIRLTRPTRLIRPQVEDLIEIYQGRGFSRRCLVQIAHRLLKSVGIHLPG